MHGAARKRTRSTWRSITSGARPSVQAPDPHAAEGEQRVRLTLLWRVIRPFRRRARFVIALIVLNTALASLGIGMVFPILQAILDPGYKSEVLSKLMPV